MNSKMTTASSVNKNDDAPRLSFLEQDVKERKFEMPQEKKSDAKEKVDNCFAPSTENIENVVIDQKHKDFAKELFNL